MAGDVPERLGVILEEPHSSALKWYKVLFDKPEMIHCNALRKVETFSGETNNISAKE